MKRDYKQIITMKTLNTAYYRMGRAYLVKFHGDPKGKDIDEGDGVIGICTEAAGGSVTFVFVKGTCVHERYNTHCVSLSCKYLDNSNIEIIPCFNDLEVLEIIDDMKKKPKHLKDDASETFPGLIVETDKTGTKLEKATAVEFISEENVNDENVEIPNQDKTESEEESGGVSLRDWNDITLGTPREEIADDVETEPDLEKFYIDDWNKIIDPNVSTRYPLFVRDEHSGDRWIINHDVLCKALYKRGVIIDISFKMKNPLRVQGFCSCNSMDVEVHVGGSVLTGKRPGKKDAPTYDAAIEFRAGDWKEMAFAHVVLRRK